MKGYNTGWGLLLVLILLFGSFSAAPSTSTTAETIVFEDRNMSVEFRVSDTDIGPHNPVIITLIAKNKNSTETLDVSLNIKHPPSVVTGKTLESTNTGGPFMGAWRSYSLAPDSDVTFRNELLLQKGYEETPGGYYDLSPFLEVTIESTIGSKSERYEFQMVRDSAVGQGGGDTEKPNGGGDLTDYLPILSNLTTVLSGMLSVFILSVIFYYHYQTNKETYENRREVMITSSIGVLESLGIEFSNVNDEDDSDSTAEAGTSQDRPD